MSITGWRLWVYGTYGIYRPSVNSPHKGRWRGTLMFPLIYARINVWANNREALWRHRNVPGSYICKAMWDFEHKRPHKIRIYIILFQDMIFLIHPFNWCFMRVNYDMNSFVLQLDFLNQIYNHTSVSPNLVAVQNIIKWISCFQVDKLAYELIFFCSFFLVKP